MTGEEIKTIADAIEAFLAASVAERPITIGNRRNAALALISALAKRGLEIRAREGEARWIRPKDRPPQIDAGFYLVATADGRLVRASSEEMIARLRMMDDKRAVGMSSQKFLTYEAAQEWAMANPPPWESFGRGAGDKNA